MPDLHSAASVAVIIVNYKTGSLACRALDTLDDERQFLPNLNVVVVDNCSPDDSFKTISGHIESEFYGEWASVIDSGHNGGYAFGNNQGFRFFTEQCQGIDYYWLLNPDTYLRPGAGFKLVSFLEATPNAIAGSRLEDDDGTPQVSTFNFPSVLTEMLAGFSLGVLDKLFKGKKVVRDIVDHPEPVDWVAGASIMLPGRVLETVGMMDQEYFLYFEEVDYCLAMRKAGFQCWYVPPSRVVHEVGAATGISDMRIKQPRRPTYWFESRRRYFRKNHGLIALILADLGWSLGYATWLLRKKITGPDDVARQPPCLLRDFLRHSALNPFRS